MASMGMAALLIVGGAAASVAEIITPRTIRSHMAQIPADGQPVTEPLAMTAPAFEGWIHTERQKLEAAKQPPHALEQSLLQRLQAGRYVTADTIITVVNAWTGYESPRGRLFPETRRLLEALQPFVYGRPRLEAQLYQHKAYLLRLADELTATVQAYDQALQLLTRLHLDIDLQRMQSTVDMADVLYALERKKEAEDLYLSALSYPWYLVRDPVVLPALRSLYVRAGTGLINTRRGNLAALKAIVFVPATREELGPVLTQAIQEAEGGAQGHGNK